MSKPRLLTDENIPKTVIMKLREHGYDVLAVWEVKPGAKDEEVVRIAVIDHRVVLTFNKEFGRLALISLSIPGVILLRIPPEKSRVHSTTSTESTIPRGRPIRGVDSDKGKNYQGDTN